MPDPHVILVTGATSGLGLETCRALARRADTQIITGVRQPRAIDALRAAVPANQLTVFPLDLASLQSVRTFAETVRGHLGTTTKISAIACNAGLQILSGLKHSAEGHEMTFAVNHLGHFLLVQMLMDQLAPGAPVVSTASGTHDPEDAGARRFGFRGGIFPSADAVARGELDPMASAKQLGIDRYATSKLCVILYTHEMARRVPANVVRFIAFDPGLMPGTGLARDRSSLEQVGWSRVLPLVSRLIPGASTPVQSAAALARLLTEPSQATGTGMHFDFTLKHTASSKDSHRLDWAADLYGTSERLVAVPRT
jgi:NAD(P)-dependent dehydrogenase (short-subunit alcohol dehydrogenase family)